MVYLLGAALVLATYLPNKYSVQRAWSMFTVALNFDLIHVVSVRTVGAAVH